MSSSSAVPNSINSKRKKSRLTSFVEIALEFNMEIQLEEKR